MEGRCRWLGNSFPYRPLVKVPSICVLNSLLSAGLRELLFGATSFV